MLSPGPARSWSGYILPDTNVTDTFVPVPSLSNRPLYDTAADERLFVVPDHWQRLFGWVHHGYNVLLSGERGSGRTSLLRQLERRLREDDTRVSFIDATQAASLHHLVALVSEGLVGRPSVGEALTERVRTLQTMFSGNEPGASSTAVQDVVRSWNDAQAQVVLLDAPGASEALYELFGRLRDELWQLEIVWVVAVDDADEATLLRPPADAFFDQRLRIDSWSAEALADMLRRRSPDLDVDQLVEAAGGNPRRALMLARDVEGGDIHRIATREQHLTAAGAISDTHRRALQAIEDLGQASASDEQLLHLLAVSRPRAHRLLNDLVDAGLLVAGSEQPTGQGRPRKLYRIKETA